MLFEYTQRRLSIGIIGLQGSRHAIRFVCTSLHGPWVLILHHRLVWDNTPRVKQFAQTTVCARGCTVSTDAFLCTTTHEGGHVITNVNMLLTLVLCNFHIFRMEIMIKRMMTMPVWEQFTRILTTWCYSSTPPCKQRYKPWARLASTLETVRNQKRRTVPSSARLPFSKEVKDTKQGFQQHRKMSWREGSILLATFTRGVPVGLGRKSGVCWREQSYPIQS